MDASNTLNMHILPSPKVPSSCINQVSPNLAIIVEGNVRKPVYPVSMTALMPFGNTRNAQTKAVNSKMSNSNAKNLCVGVPY